MSSFLPFTQLHISHSRIERTSCFTFLSFSSTHYFTIMSNYHAIFSSPQKIGPSIEGSMTTIGTDVAVFYMSCTVSSLKHFSYCWYCRLIWTFRPSHLPSPLECLTSSIWTDGLGVWSTPRHFQIPFFQSHPNCFNFTYPFSGEKMPRNAISWGCCIQYDILRLEWRRSL